MGMKWYVARRIGWAFVVTFLIISITWGLLAASPDRDVIQAGQAAAQQGESAEQAQERVRMLEGKDKPLFERYTNYMVSVYTLDWGWSESRGQPVTDAIWTATTYTAQYSVPWTILTLLIGTSMGLYSAVNQYTTKDHAMTLFAFFGKSIPNFWFGIILLLVFAVRLGWVPVIYKSSVPTFSWANAKQLILPVAVLVTGSIGTFQRVTRNEAAEYLNTDFVKTARAKGATSARIVSRHILRPASVPMSTTFVGSLIYVFVGASYLVEVVFGIPGLGLMTIQAITSQDTSLVLGSSFVFILIAVLGNLLQDLVYTLLDPRISFSDR